jgi:hypothetical protein
LIAPASTGLDGLNQPGFAIVGGSFFGRRGLLTANHAGQLARFSFTAALGQHLVASWAALRIERPENAVRSCSLVEIRRCPWSAWRSLWRGPSS